MCYRNFAEYDRSSTIVQSLHQTVFFLKETDIVLTSDEWRIALNIDLSTYHDIIATVKSDLLLVEQQKQAFTPVTELQQVERLLYVLHSRLYEFHQILPRLDPKRGLINIAGVALKSLFGTTLDSDVRF